MTKIKKRICCMLIALTFALTTMIVPIDWMGVFIAVEAAEIYGDYEYTVSSGEITITKYNGLSSNLSIPSVINGNSVIAIGSSSFSNCQSLEHIAFPNTIKVIGSSAFSGCNNLKNVTLPKNIETIGCGVFSSPYITSITIPKSMKSMGSGYSYGYSTFTGCQNLETVTFENGMTKIPDTALYCCESVKNVVIPEGVSEIGNRSLRDTGIEALNLPSTLETIGANSIWECRSLKSIIIPDNVTSIGSEAFEGCTNLEIVRFPDNLKYIGSNAFSGCNNLKNVTLPKNIETIGCGVFSSPYITSITIPKSMKSMGSGYSYGYSTFTGCQNLETVTFENGMTKIPDTALYCCESVKNVVIPEGVKKIGNRSLRDTGIESLNLPSTLETIEANSIWECRSLKSIIIPDNVTSIGSEAFKGCTALKMVYIPISVISIASNAFSGDGNLTIYGYENSYAEEYALNNDIPFVVIADEDTFIQKHLDYIGAENSNNTYHNQLQHFDLAEIALEDYGDLDDTYNLWKKVRGEIFENPYYTVLADMILSNSTAQGQLESFDIHLDSEWRSVANDIIGLINSKVDLTPSQESKIKKMFKKGDFSDETTFKFCKDVLGNKVSQDELNSIFNAYDKTNTFLDVFNQGADIVESVYDTMNYSAILKAYENTSDEFKVVLMQMAYACQMENPWLYTAIDKYLKSDYDTEMRNKIVEEVAKNGLSIGKTLFKSSIENKVKAFLINNMDLSKVGTSIASNVLAFVEGCKIGYSIGTGIDNLLFSTDDVSNSFVAASATAKTAGYLKYVLETNEANLRNNPTIKNTVLFCESYNMYKNIQLNTADTMIKYFSKNQTSLINRIFQSNNVLYEHQIYNWQILKLNWQNASCHKGYILNSKLKNVTVACPVDVTVYTNTGEIALQITDNIVQKNNGEIIATVCNNIKYITLPDDSYSIKITATESGTMTYSITDYDAFDHSSKTTCFDGISISKGNEYTGNIVSGSDYSHNDIALCYNNEEVESVVSEFTNEELIKVDSINLSSVSISLKTEETKTISATVEPSNASNKTVTWYSDNPQIAQVDEYGNVTGVSAGKTKIYCVSLEGNVVAECEISVESKYSIGDTNLDGHITISDVTAIQRHLAEMIHFTDEQLVLADTNGDNVINIMDATHLQKYLAEFDGIVLGKH